MTMKLFQMSFLQYLCNKNQHFAQDYNTRIKFYPRMILHRTHKRLLEWFISMTLKLFLITSLFC
mgnify:CR=1 FL=1